MRHARPDDLGPIEDLLEQLRQLDGLIERKPGTFSCGSTAFLHFHVDGDNLYADVKLDGTTWERERVTARAERDSLIEAVRSALL